VVTVGLPVVGGEDVAAGLLPDPLAPLVSAVMLGAEPVEPEPLDVVLPPEPEVFPPDAPGVALPGGQTTPGSVSGSWSVWPLLPEVSVP
jgi:hypothetical protein